MEVVGNKLCLPHRWWWWYFDLGGDLTRINVILTESLGLSEFGGGAGGGGAGGGGGGESRYDDTTICLTVSPM